MDQFSSCIDTVVKCLKDAKMRKSDIHDVVLVGGSIRIPKVQQLLQDLFLSKKLCTSINPDEAVAYGAALHAAVMSGVANHKDIQLVEVTPLSLGVEVYGDLMNVIIPRNTAIPVKKTAIFTAFNYQTVVRFRVYEGERHNANENNLLGSFKFSGIPPELEGVHSFSVCFEIDADGVLTVSALHIGTNNKNVIRLTNPSKKLSKEEIERMVKEAERLREQDERHVKKVKAKLDLEKYAKRVEDIMKNSTSNNIEGNRKMKVVIKNMFQWLEWNSDNAETCDFEDQLKVLESICEPLVPKLHTS